jgi:hypothetical protein
MIAKSDLREMFSEVMQRIKDLLGDISTALQGKLRDMDDQIRGMCN